MRDVVSVTDIGDLQREAYRLFKLGPGYTLAIAEKLYLQALISYPRTSSQKLPPSIGYGKIISGISAIGSYGNLTSMLLSKGRLAPNEGRMTDPAHPAIYPTGVAPRKLSGLEFKVYDLIVKRFLATFGDPAVSRRTDVAIDVNGHVFKAEGRSPVYDGWMIFYKPYVSLERLEVPELRKGDLVKNLGIDMEEKFTQPPYRYNQASLLAKMEQEKIGTKATRADIIATLFKRGYIASGRAGMEVTGLGLAVIDSMRAFVPAIVSTGLTRTMEEQLELVEQGSAAGVSVIELAVDRLVESLAAFMEKEADIEASPAGGQIGAERVAGQVVADRHPVVLVERLGDPLSGLHFEPDLSADGDGHGSGPIWRGHGGRGLLLLRPGWAAAEGRQSKGEQAGAGPHTLEPVYEQARHQRDGGGAAQLYVKAGKFEEWLSGTTEVPVAIGFFPKRN